MKKVMNDPQNIVQEMLLGMEASAPELLKKMNGFDVILNRDLKGERVTLISGGGSGHEPAHGGYVGKGMLDAAVAGPVFTSPGPDQILEGIKAIDKSKGVLMIIKNYSGDVMNFQMAREMAEMEGIKTDFVIVNDDVAVGEPERRRGIAGTVFVHKIAGAKAMTGASLKEVKETAQKTINNVRSKGIALEPCILPHNGQPSFQISSEKMEIGLGIHGEPGLKQTEILTAREIAEDLVMSLKEDLGLENGENIAVMVNGLGATPLMELQVFFNEVVLLCQNKGINIIKTHIGNYMTSLNMAGLSLTFLRTNQEMSDLLNAPANTLSFR